MAMPIPRATVEAMSSENKKEYDWKADGSSRPFLSIVNLTDGEDELECSKMCPSYAPVLTSMGGLRMPSAAK